MQGFKVLTVICALVSLVAANAGKISTKSNNDPCKGLDDGVFFPVAGDCTKFLLCYGGVAVEQDCGKYHFNPKLHICEHPDKAGCQSTLFLTTSAPTKSVCSGYKDGTMLPVTGSSSKYYICMSEKAFLEDCGTLMFHPAMMQCIPQSQNTRPTPPTPPCYAVANGISIPVSGNPRQYYYCLNNKAFLKDCGNLYFVAKYSACARLPEDESQLSYTSVKPVVPSINKESEVTACYGKPNGVSIAVAGSQRQFYYCLFNKAFLKDCGNLYFVAKHSACGLFPDNESQTVANNVQPVVPSKNQEAAVTVCYGKPNGVSIAVSGNKRQFYYCLDNKAFLKDCGNLFYVAKYSACGMFPDNESPTVANNIQPAIPSTNQEAAVTVCYGKPNGVSIAVAGNNRHYYYCLNNKAFLKDCGNLFFVAKYSACAMFPDNESQTVPSIKKEAELTVCYGKPSGTSITVPGNQRQYYYCMNNKAFLKDCGHLFFASKYSACATTPDSKEIGYPAEEITMTESFDEIARRECKNQAFGARVAFPGTCSWYIICTYNAGFLKSCSWREFNPKTASCDLPENVQCSAHVAKATTKTNIIPTTATPIDTLAARICKNEEDGTFKAAPGQCSDFYFCLQKKGYRKSCGPNRHFDSKSVTCIDSKESSCVDIWPIAPRGFSPRAASCANQEIGTLVSSDTDCTKFYVCDNQGPVELDCPAGLHFSAKEKLCDWPVNAECSLKK